MLNLIKKDLIVCVKSERFNVIKYILIFILMYLFCNDISYYATPVIITYLIMIGVFSSDYDNNSDKFIRSIPIDLDDIVYSRYLIGAATSIVITILTLFIHDILSISMFRRTVFYDFVFAMNINLIVLSITMPLFFRYGYEKIKIAASILAIAIFTIFGAFLNALSEKIYRAANTGVLVAMNTSRYETIHALNQIFRGIVSKINVDSINIVTVVVACIIIFIISMGASLKAMKKNRYIK